MRLPPIVVAAFARRPDEGNPAAVVRLDDWCDDTAMQAVAARLALPATSFVVALAGDADADFAVRWFGPAREIGLCGHGTLAAAHVLIGERDRVRFRTRTGDRLTVDRNERGYSLSLPAIRPQAGPLPDVVAAVGGAPLATLWHDDGYAMLVYPDEGAVRALTPDFAALRRLGNILVVATARGRVANIASRAFAPASGQDEDAATGSAHAVIAPYWAAALGRAEFTAFQASARGGWLQCRVEGERVIVSGDCVTIG